MTALIIQQKQRRWAYLVLSVFLLLFLGLIYAWSVFRIPLEQEFGWSKSGTSLTFSISMVMFCLGGLISGVLTARKGMRITLVLAALLLVSGFGLASQITSLMGIYLTYGGMAGLGVGLGYNAAISTIMRWFPDKQGLVSGIALMGFGFGAMILGTAGASLISLAGWRMTFLLIAASYAVVIALAVVILRPPDADFTAALSGALPKGKEAREEIGWQDMLRRQSFWLFFLWAILLSAAGLSIINISAGYAGTFVGGNLTQAAAIAGVISIANGAGRVLAGQLFDSKGCKVTMYSLCGLSGSGCCPCRCRCEPQPACPSDSLCPYGLGLWRLSADGVCLCCLILWLPELWHEFQYRQSQSYRRFDPRPHVCQWYAHDGFYHHRHTGRYRSCHYDGNPPLTSDRQQMDESEGSSCTPFSHRSGLCRDDAFRFVCVLPVETNALQG